MLNLKKADKREAETRVSPEGHDVSVGAEAGHAGALAHLDHVGPQDEGGLRDVVFGDARLGGQGQDLGLFLRTHHGVLVLAEVLGHGRGHRDRPALADLLSLLAVRRGVGFVPGLVGVGQHRPRRIQEGHPQDGALQPHQHA